AWPGKFFRGFRQEHRSAALISALGKDYRSRLIPVCYERRWKTFFQTHGNTPLSVRTPKSNWMRPFNRMVRVGIVRATTERVLKWSTLRSCSSPFIGCIVRKTFPERVLD